MPYFSIVVSEMPKISFLSKKHHIKENTNEIKQN